MEEKSESTPEEAIMSPVIERSVVDEALFQFLRSIYLFERRESQLFGVTWDEVYLMQLLAKTPGMRLVQLAEALRVPRFTATRMLVRLELGGLLRREGSEKDKRAVHVHLTDAGHAKVRQIEDYNYETIVRQAERVPDSLPRQLLEAVSRLPALLDLEDGDGSNQA